MRRHRLLEPFVAALEQLDGRSHDDLRVLFAAVANRRPELLERSLFAERSRRTSEIEKILRKSMAELGRVEQAGALPEGMSVPYLCRLRLNHATGRLHVGHGDRSIVLFPENSN
ncbi:hypothetical protein LB535_10335 [Mesorhizobium sp. CA10]|uniref:hypothetical protein n=1 Tax=Mesorhizobium sp. CA10 TaxID=588495 RepID=UPI001CCAC0D8|nr:hypothetical protein [Mesorhizobium sp. CA10]MBZ9882751.1 hypothetical protein [Mesorhizobium sp. CA10]